NDTRAFDFRNAVRRYGRLPLLPWKRKKVGNLLASDLAAGLLPPPLLPLGGNGADGRKPCEMSFDSIGLGFSRSCSSSAGGLPSGNRSAMAAWRRLFCSCPTIFSVL